MAAGAIVAAAALLFPTTAGAQYTIENAQPNQLVAGSTGNTIMIVGSLPTFPSGTQEVCFFTGYGGSNVGINPTSDTIVIPDAYIDQIPPGQYNADGRYSGSLYIANSGDVCNGTPPGTNNVANISLVLPEIASVSSAALQQANTATGVMPPPKVLDFTGYGFLSTTTVMYSWSGGSGTGTGGLLPDGSLVSTVPGIPAAVTTVTAAPCNSVGSFSYCGSPQTLPVNSLAASSGSMNANPSPPLATMPVTLTAQFAASGTPANNPGAPTGIVSFAGNGSALGTARLVLDPAAGLLTPIASQLVDTPPVGKMLVADVNGDGLPDVIYVDSSGDFAVFLGTTPYGTLSSPVVSLPDPNCGYGVNSFAIGDVNGDGYPDLVFDCATGTAPDNIDVALGSGDGNFAAATTLSGTFGNEVALGDLDHNGTLDLVVTGPLNACYPACSASYGFAIFQGDGKGNFTLANTLTTNGGAPTEVTVANIDGDVYPDIVGVNRYSGTPSIDIYINSGNGTTFGIQSSPYTLPTTSILLGSPSDTYQNLVVGDFNGDGLLDVAVEAGETRNQIVYAYNTTASGTVSFSAPQTFNIPNPGVSVSAADFNGDGLTDIAVADSNGLTVYDSTGTAFATDYAGLVAAPASSQVLGAVAVDLNVDGDADAMLAIEPSGASGQFEVASYLTSGPANASLTTSFASSPSEAVTATWPGNLNFSGSTASENLMVYGQTTTTTLSLPNTPSEYGQTVALQATVTSSTGVPTGTITFIDGKTPLATVAMVNGAASYPTAALAAGTHAITAVYSGDPTYMTSNSSIGNQVVNRGNTAIAWNPSPSTLVYGTALSSAQLDATSSTKYFASVPGTFTYNPLSGAVLTAGDHTLSLTFTPTDTADFATVTTTTSITVNRATPTINWATPAPIVYGTLLSSTQLNATATGTLGTVAGSLVYTPAVGAMLSAGNNQVLSVTFRPTDTNDYNQATGGTTINVSKATPTLTWTQPAGIPYGTALSATQLNATATGVAGALAGAFVYTPAVGTVLGAGNNQALGVTFTPTDTVDYNIATGGTTISVSKATPTISWTAPAGISYGTALSSTQLNATATGIAGALAGTFVYTPIGGTVLSAGNNQALSVSFTPTDAVDYNVATGGTTISVGKVTPTVSWTAPATIVVGTPLSSTQLNATATGIAGALAGTFAYTPAAGTVLSVGNNQALSATFTPTDVTDYNTALGNTAISVIGLTLTTVSPATATLGDAAKTLTLTGVGFLSNSVAQVNGTALATTYVNATTLTAVLPASYFQTVQTLSITVSDPTQGQTSNSNGIAVGAPAPVVTFTGPGTVQPAQQPTLTFSLNSYPVALTGTMTLTFAGTAGADDPSIQFSTGGRTYSFTVAANSTTVPAILLQSGTDAGTITVTLTLTAGGQNVTPGSVQPLVIVVPAVVPSLTSLTLTRSGDTVTVNAIGFSNTRQVTQAEFKFTGAGGQAIDNPDVIVDVTTLFSTWFANVASQAYGSAFLYTQTFNLNTSESNIGSVTLTLTNSSGASTSATAQ